MGVSGSGKSTFCKENLEPSDIYLSSDFYRGVLGKDESDQSVSAAVFQTLELMTLYFLSQNKRVIVDATLTHKKSRKPFIDIARRLDKMVVCYFLDVPIEICKERNTKRSRVVPESVIGRQFANLTVPGPNEVDFLYVVNELGDVVSKNCLC